MYKYLIKAVLVTILKADFWKFCCGLKTLDHDNNGAAVVGLVQFDLDSMHVQ